MLDRGMRAGRLLLREVQPVCQVAGRVFGVVGCGVIGKAVARKATSLGYRAVVHDILRRPGTTTPES